MQDLVLMSEDVDITFLPQSFHHHPIGMKCRWRLEIINLMVKRSFIYDAINTTGNRIVIR